MRQNNILPKLSLSLLILILVVVVSQLIIGDLKNINFGFKSLLRCGLIVAGGDTQSPFVEGTEKDYWVYRGTLTRSYRFFQHDIVMRGFDLVEKRLKKVENYLHPENILKGHDPKQKLSKEKLQEVMQALKGPQDPESIQRDKLLPVEEAIANANKYSGRCYTVKRGLFDLRKEDAMIHFGAKSSQ